MKEVRYSTQAKKDLKRYRHDISKMRDLFEVLHTLSNEEQLDQQYRPHMLSGGHTFRTIQVITLPYQTHSEFEKNLCGYFFWFNSACKDACGSIWGSHSEAT